MAADTYSALLGFLKMGTGNDNNTWGDNANSAVFQIFEDAIAGVLSNAVTGGTLDLSGSPPPAAASQARYSQLIFTGTLASNQIVQVPNLKKGWWVKNATSGAFTLTIKTPSGSASSAIPQNGGWQWVTCDGNNVITVSPFNSIQVQMGDGAAAAPAYSYLNEPTSGLYRAGAGDHRFSVLGSDVFQLTGTSVNVLGVTFKVGGNAVLSANQVVPAADGTLTAPGISFNNEPNTGIYRVGLGDIGFSVLEALRAELTSTSFSWQGNTFAGSDLTPASISSNQNDYSPAGLGLIQTLGSITGGSLYTNGTYQNVALTGGSGTGARATIVVSGGAVSSVTLTNRGTGYVAGNTLSALTNDIGGTGSGFSVPVATVDAMTASCLRLNVTATVSLTGIAGGAAGRELTLVNVGSATLKCPANSASSSAANRFASAFNLAPGQSIGLRYDGTSNLWRPKNQSVAVAAGAPAYVSGDLSITNHTGSETTKLDISCSEAVLTDATGNPIKFKTVSVQLNTATSGAGGIDTGTLGTNECHIYLVSDGVNIAAMISLSSTGPSFTNAPNYLYWKRIGARFTSGGLLSRMKQLGNYAQYVSTSPPVQVPGASGNIGGYGSTTITWTACSVSGVLPSTAARGSFVLTGGLGSAALAPNTNFTGKGGTNPAPGIIDGQSGASIVDMTVEGTTVQYAGNHSASGVTVLGWTDTI